ncbi:MAG: surface-adhesin E family protein [Sterolibacterium sp.]
MSVRIQEEYNCKEQQVRVVYVSYHAGHMGGGQTISVNSVPDRWFPIGGLSSDVPTKLLWRAVCERQ